MPPNHSPEPQGGGVGGNGGEHLRPKGQPLPNAALRQPLRKPSPSPPSAEGAPWHRATPQTRQTVSQQTRLHTNTTKAADPVRASRVSCHRLPASTRGSSTTRTHPRNTVTTQPLPQQEGELLVGLAMKTQPLSPQKSSHYTPDTDTHQRKAASLLTEVLFFRFSFCWLLFYSARASLCLSCQTLLLQRSPSQT